MTRSLGSYEDDVDVCRSVDVAETDVEAVAEDQNVSGFKVVLDVGGVEATLVLVGSKDHNNVSPLGCLGAREHLEASVGCLGGALRALLEANLDLNTGVAQVQCVRVAL